MVKVVEWHTELVSVVLEVARHDRDLFAKNVNDYRSQVELSMELSKLVAVEKIQLGQHPIQPCSKWGVLDVNTRELTKRIEIAIATYSLSVDSRLKEHSNNFANSSIDGMKVYDYKEHVKDLAILKVYDWPLKPRR